MSDIRIKRGASLSLNIGFANADGTPTALSGLTLTAMVRDAEETLVATLTPAPTGTPGQATIYVRDTSAWPQGLLRMDVMAVIPGGAQSISETVGIYVDDAITQTLPPPAPFDAVTS